MSRRFDAIGKLGMGRTKVSQPPNLRNAKSRLITAVDRRRDLNRRSGLVGELGLGKSEVRVWGTREIRVRDLIQVVNRRDIWTVDLASSLFRKSGERRQGDLESRETRNRDVPFT